MKEFVYQGRNAKVVFSSCTRHGTPAPLGTALCHTFEIKPVRGDESVPAAPGPKPEAVPL